ncbi:PAS domain-containing sensor histidine kinase [Sulfurospirillum arcachonense]|uniref:sensor histidine kinase n=1 Tax=Sulfurospirillum arcachonense TaxID=57666 RepID=UPI00046981B6|nr:PAS domain-containing sensor histidine kinase [Sulfurospirillum arcachonense]
MQKKLYSLNDIGKLLTYIPPIFLLLLATIFVITSYFITQYKQKSDIQLLNQKQKFINQNILDEYISSINKTIKMQLAQSDQELKKSVHTLKGIQIGFSSDYKKIQNHIKNIEQKNNINFVVFDKEFHIYHGLNTLTNIQQLIFNHKNNKNYLDLTLLYIISQGENSSLSWKDDFRNTIQLSYFEKSIDGNYMIGAFSSLDSQENLLIKSYLSSIRKHKKDSHEPYFWLYDYAKKNVFNLNNQKKWQIINSINKESIYQDFEKYQLYIGIAPNKQALMQNIKKIKMQYKNKHLFNVFIIVIFTMILVSFTIIFSSFIKNIFSSYNRRFASKNRQLKRLKQRYELAVIASNDGLWDTNFKTGTTFFSKKWLDILGYKTGEITTYKQWLNLLHAKDRKNIEEMIQLHVKDKKENHLICEYRLKTKDGSFKWMLARGKIFMDTEGNAERLLMMSMDIDAKKEATKHLKALVKKEVAKNEEKQKLLIQQNKLAAMGEMIGSIAHQWRQPLNNISLIIHFIRDNINNKNFKEEQLNTFVNKAKEQITYMSETIDDFRDFYKPSKNIELFDIKIAITSTINIMQTQLEKNSIHVKISGTSLAIYGYENEFKQAILNIISNAKDAIVSQKEKNPSLLGEILINIFKQDNKNIITISNNGAEASQEVLERMFEPYYTTKFENQGTGIGLYMTKTIIETNMKGTINAKNSNGGVIFTLVI